MEEQTTLVQEYKALDQSGADLAGLQSDDEDRKDYFDPALVPETTMVYPTQGAEILSFRILDLDGQTANVLTLGQEYCFEVSGKFLVSRERIYFGTHIRTISGVSITGQRYPEEGKYIEKVQAGERFRITYRYRMGLLPGTYFSGGGVWSSEEPTCLHRIMDAVMFRVIAEHNSTSSGYVDLSSKEPTLEIF